MSAPLGDDGAAPTQDVDEGQLRPDPTPEVVLPEAVILEAPAARNGDRVPPWLSRAIALAAGWVVLLFAAAWGLQRLRSLIVMVVVAFFLFSLAMEPAVDRLARRGWRRGSATGLVLGGVFVLMLVFLAAAGSIVVGQANDLIDNAPRYVRDFEQFVNDDLGIDFNADSLVRQLQSDDGPLNANNAIVSNALDVAVVVGRGLLEFATVLIFAFYMTADGPRMRRVICSRLPRARQEIVLDTWEIAIDKTGGYLYSRGILAVVSTLVTWGFLFALGVPYSLALALWVGIVSQFIPTVGTYIAAALPLVVAFKSSPADALWVLVFLTVYQQFENYILSPKVTKHSMDVHPALAIGTVFVGGLLFGAVGAILALPATAVIQAILSSYTTEREVIDAPLLEEPARETRLARLRNRFRRNAAPEPEAAEERSAQD